MSVCGGKKSKSQQFYLKTKLFISFSGNIMTWHFCRQMMRKVLFFRGRRPKTLASSCQSFYQALKGFMCRARFSHSLEVLVEGQGTAGIFAHEISHHVVFGPVLCVFDIFRGCANSRRSQGCFSISFWFVFRGQQRTPSSGSCPGLFLFSAWVQLQKRTKPAAAGCCCFFTLNCWPFVIILA